MRTKFVCGVALSVFGISGCLLTGTTVTARVPPKGQIALGGGMHGVGRLDAPETPNTRGESTPVLFPLLFLTSSYGLTDDLAIDAMVSTSIAAELGVRYRFLRNRYVHLTASVRASAALGISDIPTLNVDPEVWPSKKRADFLMRSHLLATFDLRYIDLNFGVLGGASFLGTAAPQWEADTYGQAVRWLTQGNHFLWGGRMGIGVGGNDVTEVRLQLEMTQYAKRFGNVPSFAPPDSVRPVAWTMLLGVETHMPL
jgi:hypothetical protein